MMSYADIAALAPEAKTEVAMALAAEIVRDRAAGKPTHILAAKRHRLDVILRIIRGEKVPLAPDYLTLKLLEGDR